jgi:hypothetical protein
MSAALARCGEERRVIDINPIRSNLVAAQMKNIGEWQAQHRAVVARIRDLPLANRGRCPVPGIEQPVPAGRYRREKRRHGRVDGFMANDRRSIAESKLRIWSEQPNEPSRVAGVDDRKHPLPPGAIGLKERRWRGGVVGSYHFAQHTRRRDNVVTYSG